MIPTPEEMLSEYRAIVDKQIEQIVDRTVVAITERNLGETEQTRLIKALAEEFRQRIVSHPSEANPVATLLAAAIVKLANNIARAAEAAETDEMCLALLGDDTGLHLMTMLRRYREVRLGIQTAEWTPAEIADKLKKQEPGSSQP